MLPSPSLDDLARQRLPRGATLAVDGGMGVRVRVLAGEAWITEEGSAIDLVIAAGESCPLTRPGRALLEMRSRGQLVLEPGAGGGVPRRVLLRETRHTPWIVLFDGPGAMVRLQASLARIGLALRRSALRSLRVALARRARRAVQVRY